MVVVGLQYKDMEHQQVIIVLLPIAPTVLVLVGMVFASLVWAKIVLPALTIVGLVLLIVEMAIATRAKTVVIVI